MSFIQTSYRFDEYPRIAGSSPDEKEAVGDYFEAFDLIDGSGRIKSIFKTVNQGLRVGGSSFFTLLKMKATGEVFYPNTLELHVQREDNDEMDLGHFQSIVAKLLSEEENQAVSVTRRRDRKWCVISINSSYLSNQD